MRLENRKTALADKARPLYDLLIGGEIPVFILGTNDTGRQLDSVLKTFGRQAQAFINDFGAMQDFCGRPVIKTADVPQQALVVSCSTAVNPVSAMRQLKTAGVSDALDYFTVYLSGNGVFPPPKFCAENVADIEAHRPKYEWVASLLADEISRTTFQQVVEFRYNFDLSCMVSFRSRLEAQYFEPFVPLKPGEIFVDGGGFDGKTSKTFIQKCPGYRHVHYFEPDPLLMASSKEHLRPDTNITFHQTALSDREGEVTFNQTGTGSGSVSEAGQLRVKSCRLDGLLPEPATFVKLDVEGAEFAALCGGAELVRTAHPKLAICVYHRQSDFWRIPEKVLSLYSGYRVYLRHYTEGVEETVMYFV